MLNKKRSNQSAKGNFLLLLPLLMFLFSISNITNAQIQNRKVATNSQQVVKKHVNSKSAKSETMPEYPGGQEEMMRFLKANIQLPKEAKGKYRVLASFTVEADGNISDIKIMKSSDADFFDNEVIRVIKMMPKWIPGTSNGEPINVKFALPVVFKQK